MVVLTLAGNGIHINKDLEILQRMKMGKNTVAYQVKIESQNKIVLIKMYIFFTLENRIRSLFLGISGG